ncbi:MAG: hypothetical protein ACTSO2_19545 [Promethearchaeota archaeon]
MKLSFRGKMFITINCLTMVALGLFFLYVNKQQKVEIPKVEIPKQELVQSEVIISKITITGVIIDKYLLLSRGGQDKYLCKTIIKGIKKIVVSEQKENFQETRMTVVKQSDEYEIQNRDIFFDTDIGDEVILTLNENGLVIKFVKVRKR